MNKLTERMKLQRLANYCREQADYYRTLSELNPERAKQWEPSIANYTRYAALADARLKAIPETEEEKQERHKTELEGRLGELSLLLAADVAGLKVENLTAAKHEYAEKYNELRELNGEAPLAKKSIIV